MSAGSTSACASCRPISAGDGDIDDILVSSAKVTKRGQKIEALEFAAGASESRCRGRACGRRKNRVADSKTGQLRLRVVEGDEA